MPQAFKILFLQGICIKLQGVTDCPYSAWRMSSDWCVISGFIPYEKSPYDVSSFIRLCFPIRKFPTLTVTFPCLLPQANLHRSSAIIAVIAVFVHGISDSIVTSCQTYSGAPRTYLPPLFPGLIQVILKSTNELAIDGIITYEWCFQLTPDMESARGRCTVELEYNAT